MTNADEKREQDKKELDEAIDDLFTPTVVDDIAIQREMTKRTAIRWWAFAAVCISAIASFTVIFCFLAVYNPGSR